MTFNKLVSVLYFDQNASLLPWNYMLKVCKLWDLANSLEAGIYKNWKPFIGSPIFTFELNFFGILVLK